ncbi:collagen alpha-1(I) chain-like [Choloepus didactylus]|uniref:collagen alpha-1(I) chain-like n=1 Tax=Choloepus didactylus TaxID=27675 RepID=UPI00189F177B|nr:collagen alpha-1(I) chain-like [Choloepus didactylus]
MHRELVHSLLTGICHRLRSTPHTPTPAPRVLQPGGSLHACLDRSITSTPTPPVRAQRPCRGPPARAVHSGRYPRSATVPPAWGSGGGGPAGTGRRERMAGSPRSRRPALAPARLPGHSHSSAHWAVLFLSCLIPNWAGSTGVVLREQEIGEGGGEEQLGSDARRKKERAARASRRRTQRAARRSYTRLAVAPRCPASPRFPAPPSAAPTAGSGPSPTGDSASKDSAGGRPSLSADSPAERLAPEPRALSLTTPGNPDPAISGTRERAHSSVRAAESPPGPRVPPTAPLRARRPRARLVNSRRTPPPPPGAPPVGRGSAVKPPAGSEPRPRGASAPHPPLRDEDRAPVRKFLFALSLRAPRLAGPPSGTNFLRPQTRTRRTGLRTRLRRPPPPPPPRCPAGPRAQVELGSARGARHTPSRTHTHAFHLEDRPALREPTPAPAPDSRRSAAAALPRTDTHGLQNFHSANSRLSSQPPGVDRPPPSAPLSPRCPRGAAQPAALGVGPAEGWALGRVGAGRARCLRAGGDSPARSSGLPRLLRARPGSTAPAPPPLPPALGQEPQRHVDGLPRAPARAGRGARPPFSKERSSASPCRWEPGLRLPPHAAIPTRPPSLAQRSGDSRPPAAASSSRKFELPQPPLTLRCGASAVGFREGARVLGEPETDSGGGGEGGPQSPSGGDGGQRGRLSQPRADSPRYPEGQWTTAITIKRLALGSAKAVKPQRQPPLPPLATSAALSRPRVPSETRQSLSYMKTPPPATAAVPPELEPEFPGRFNCGATFGADRSPHKFPLGNVVLIGARRWRSACARSSSIQLTRIEPLLRTPRSAGRGALGEGGGRPQAAGSGEARFRPHPRAQSLKGKKPQFIKLAGRDGSGGGVFRPNRTQTAGPDVAVKGEEAAVRLRAAQKSWPGRVRSRARLFRLVSVPTPPSPRLQRVNSRAAPGRECGAGAGAAGWFVLRGLTEPSAPSERAAADSRASRKAHTRPISQPEFPSGEPSGAAPRPGAGSAGPSRARFRVPGPGGKLSRQGRPLPGWRRGAGLRFTCPPYQRRRRRGGGGQGDAQPLPQGLGPPPPRWRLGRDHPAAPSPRSFARPPARAERGAARRREAPRAPLQELRGGGSQERVLLAAAPGTSRPPRRRRRRRSHGDRKLSRRPERPPLAPRAVPDDDWKRVTHTHTPSPHHDPSWFQATALALGHPHLSPEDPPCCPGRLPSAASISTRPHPLKPRSWDGRGAEPPLRPGRNTCSRALQLGAWCRERLPTVVCRDRGGENGAPKLSAKRSPNLPPLLGDQDRSQHGARVS